MTRHYRWDTTLEERRRDDPGIDDPARRSAAQETRHARDVGYHLAQMRKQRGLTQAAVVPVPPPLVRLIRAHIADHGTTADGRLFRGHYGGDLSESTYGRTWERARENVFTAAQMASSLAKRPYDLRHACVSTWLKAGTEPKRVAEWAGHSVNVLLRIYTLCLDGWEHEARQRIQRTLEDG